LVLFYILGFKKAIFDIQVLVAAAFDSDAELPSMDGAQIKSRTSKPVRKTNLHRPNRPQVERWGMFFKTQGLETFLTGLIWFIKQLS
jgi:hypothetical protein